MPTPSITYMVIASVFFLSIASVLAIWHFGDFVRKRQNRRSTATTQQTSGGLHAQMGTGAVDRLDFTGIASAYVRSARKRGLEAGLLYVAGNEESLLPKDASATSNAESLHNIAHDLRLALATIVDQDMPVQILWMEGHVLLVLFPVRDALRDLEAVGRFTFDVIASRIENLSGGKVSVGAASSTETQYSHDFVWHARLAARMATMQDQERFQSFDPAMVASYKERQELLRDLRDAVVLEQFELLYQPKVDAKSGQVLGVEALIRWKHPTRGTLGPGDFISLAEQSGLIETIGLWALDRACRQITLWRHEALRMQVAVNVSAVQLRNPKFAEQALAVIQKHKVPFNKVTLEVTESQALQASNEVVSGMRRLAANGVQISIDDFGSGYSNLSTLSSLPVRELKIDRTFIMQLDSNPTVRFVIKAIASLARSIGARVVGEGVETDSQRLMLLQLGCEIQQGYLFSRPLAADTLYVWALTARGEFSPKVFADTTTPTEPAPLMS